MAEEVPLPYREWFDDLSGRFAVGGNGVGLGAIEQLGEIGVRIAARDTLRHDQQVIGVVEEHPDVSVRPALRDGPV